MKWLNRVVDELVSAHPEGEIIVSSGVSPSGTYHVGTLREVLTADAVRFELERRGRKSRHLHVVDDLDVFRKVPANVPAEFKKYLGKPLCDIPAPDDSKQSYADFFLNDFLGAAQKLNLKLEVIRSHEKYRSGAMDTAIEKALMRSDKIRAILESVSGHKLDENWSPVQVMEEGYLKTRKFLSLDKAAKKISYADLEGKEQTANYNSGEVKLSWRVDWPARWWMFKVACEPFGRDHATKGGSYDTGAEIIRQVYGAEPPAPLPYHFINRAGETKKMSKSSGQTISTSELAEILPPEIVRYFILHAAPSRQLFFDEVGLTKLIDEYAQALAKPDKTAEEKQLIELCGGASVVSAIPFSHLVESYQASRRRKDRTLEVLRRSEYKKIAEAQSTVIEAELVYIDKWLDKWAPEDMKFEVVDDPASYIGEFDDKQKEILTLIASEIEKLPEDAAADDFHKAIYAVKEAKDLKPDQVFKPLYKILIHKEQGPRAGHFLADLEADSGRKWLVDRLRAANGA